MYSLWFLRDAPPPDVLLTVGTGRAVHQFAGHRALLASHSGYLKAQLATDTHSVTVPNVAPEVFAPLLTFMYTGYLDLTPENIYAVLLATHLLHMPRALDLCRSYLVQSQPPTLVKPVPSRKPFPSLLSAPVPTSSLYWTPPPLLPTTVAPDTPFRPVFPPLVDTTITDPTTDPARESPPAVPSTSAERQSSPPPSSLSPCLSQTSDASDQVTVTVSRPKTSSKIEDKVIVDVASCDGPVRFHRVLNQNYGKSKSSSSITNSGEKSSEEGHVYTCQFCDHTFKSQYCYQKHARRHLNPVPVKTPKPKPAKREVRLLDMNVQYYPCKTCGSKFPSYYFVHKHRKICHPLEEAKANVPSSAGAPPPGSDSDTSELTV